MQADILTRFSALSARYGELRHDLALKVPDGELAEWITWFERLADALPDGRWMKATASYSNLFELILQYFVCKTISNPPPAIKIDARVEPSNICVRFVRSPNFFVESIPADPFYYIVVSEPAYTLPLHTGLALTLLSMQQPPSSEDCPVTTDLLGGKSAAAALLGNIGNAQPVLNSLFTSAMDAIVGARQDWPREFFVRLDRENQRQFEDSAVRMLRWGGESPFEHGIGGAAPYFPLVFLLYGVMHEVGHLWFRHSAGLREQGEELASDLAAISAIEQLFPSHSCRVPVAVAAAAVFYAVTEYLSFLEAKPRFWRGAADDLQSYRSIEGLPDPGISGYWEHMMIKSRAVGAAASAAWICAPYFLGARDDISLFWSLLGEIEFVTSFALDVPGVIPQEMLERIHANFRSKYSQVLRERIESSKRHRRSLTHP